MGFHSHLVIDTGDDEPTSIRHFNAPSCAMGVYRNVVGRDFRDDLHNRLAADALPDLNRVVDATGADPGAMPEAFETDSPCVVDTDWGYVATYYRDLRDACAKHPKTTIHIGY